MAAKRNSHKIKPGSATSVIPRQDWGQFLETFGGMHRGWLTSVETLDVVTEERVVTQESPLDSMELDLEDERNPRINVSIKLDNKSLKHILFLPTSLVLHESTEDREESLEIETLNTTTTVHVRPPIALVSSS